MAEEIEDHNHHRGHYVERVIGNLLAVVGFGVALYPVLNGIEVPGLDEAIIGCVIAFAGIVLTLLSQHSDTSRQINSYRTEVKKMFQKSHEQDVALKTALYNNSKELSNILRTQVEMRQTMEAQYEEAIERISSAVRIPIYDANYLSILGGISKLIRDTKNSAHLRRRFIARAESFIRTQAAETNAIAIDYYDRTHEHDRMTRLEEVIEDSSQYVWAVTYDFDDYLLVWSPASARYTEYLKSQSIRKRVSGVDIQRVLVVGDDVVSRHSKLKALAVDKLVRAHLETGLPLKIVSRESLGDLWDGPVSGFLVADDCVTSKSYHETGGVLMEGWVAIGKPGEADRLKDQFRRLEYADELVWTVESFGG